MSKDYMFDNIPILFISTTFPLSALSLLCIAHVNCLYAVCLLVSLLEPTIQPIPKREIQFAIMEAALDCARLFFVMGFVSAKADIV